MSPELWSGIVGLFVPYLVQFVRAIVNKEQRWIGFVIAYTTSIIVATGTVLLTGQFDNVLSSLGTLLLSSQAVYNLYFVPAKQDEMINRLVQ